MDTNTFDLAMLVLRTTLGGMIMMHGYNHLFGPGGVEGTARWFASLGFRPAKLHALMSGWVELASGAGLIAGFLTAPAAAALIGTMTVAGWAAHRPNGFFIFRDGYEYVLVVAVAAFALGALGPGEWSLDNAFGIVGYHADHTSGLLGTVGALLTGVGGIAGGATLLALGWRPIRKPAEDKVTEAV